VRTLATLPRDAAVLSCGNSRSGGNEDRMPPTKRGAVVRSIIVRLSTAEAGVDLDGVHGFLATQRCALGDGGKQMLCHLPPLDVTGPHRVAIIDLMTTTPLVTIEPGTIAEGGAPVVLEMDRAKLANGTQLHVEVEPALGPREYIEARWHAPVAAPGPLLRLAGIRGTGRWVMEAYDPADGTRLWRNGASELFGEPIGMAVAPDGSAVALALKISSAEAAFELIAFDGSAGTIRWRASVAATPLATLLFSTDGAELMVLARDPARCESCVKIIVVSPHDGNAVREMGLPADSVAARATSAGFTGETAWFYSYVPAHMTSELAPAGRTRVRSACQYEVHDLHTPGKPRRTLLDAEGEWKKVAAACEVRTLIPLTDGHIAAIQVIGETELAIVEFDAAP
jgi:hypothetical protein